jgi:anti-sigma factor RsiW
MLSAYLDGELTAKERQHLEGHLAQCDACAEELRTLRYAKAMLVEAPALRIPRSFVVRRADLEVPAEKAPRRLFGLSSKLAYAYMRGATALVVVAFAMLVAGDLLGQFSIGSQQPVMLVEREVASEVTVVVQEMVEKEVATQVTAVVEKAVEEPVPVQETIVVEVEREAEKVVAPDATPSPAMREAAPPAKTTEEEAVQALAVPEAGPTQAAGAEDSLVEETVGTQEVYGEGDTPLPAPTPTVTSTTPSPLPPTPTGPPPPTPEPTAPVVAQETGIRVGLGTLRAAEIGLGALALTLLVITLIFRRQQL